MTTIRIATEADAEEILAIYEKYIREILADIDGIALVSIILMR